MRELKINTCITVIYQAADAWTNITQSYNFSTCILLCQMMNHDNDLLLAFKRSEAHFEPMFDTHHYSITLYHFKHVYIDTPGREAGLRL